MPKASFKKSADGALAVSLNVYNIISQADIADAMTKLESVRSISEIRHDFGHDSQKKTAVAEETKIARFN